MTVKQVQPRTFAVLLGLCLGACSGSLDAEEGAPTSKGPAKATPPNTPVPTDSTAPMASGPGVGKTPTATPPLEIPSTGLIESAPGPSTRFSRLSHRQWENTVRDLLKLTALPGLTPTFISEPARSAFDNNGGLLQIEPQLWKDYQRGAETMAEKVARDPAQLAKLIPATAPADLDGRARAFVQSFGLRAYRRPLTVDEITAHVALFKQGVSAIGGADPIAAGAELVISVMLQSPHFIYRTELSSTVANGRVPLSGYEVASRLSYGLMGTMPDDTLFAAAEAKQLGTKAEIALQADRLLKRSGAQDVVRDFHDQVLNTAKYDFIGKDEKKFPDYKAGMNADMKAESRAFVKDVVFTQEKGLAELFTAPYSFVNSRLGPLYGLTMATPATGQPDPFNKVMLNPAERAGVLSQVGFLAAYADTREPNTIRRGSFILLDLMCTEIPDPPDNIPALPSPTPSKTNRQRIEAHTQVGICAGCHTSLINPLGFALESFDALGKWRVMDGTLPLDNKTSFSFDGQIKAIKGPVELAKNLAESRQLHDCYARNWMEYVYGRSVNDAADKALISELGLRSLKANAPVKKLLVDLVATDSFLMRTP